MGINVPDGSAPAEQPKPALEKNEATPSKNGNKKTLCKTDCGCIGERHVDNGGKSETHGNQRENDSQNLKPQEISSQATRKVAQYRRCNDHGHYDLSDQQNLGNVQV